MLVSDTQNSFSNLPDLIKGSLSVVILICLLTEGGKLGLPSFRVYKRVKRSTIIKIAHKRFADLRGRVFLI